MSNPLVSLDSLHVNFSGCSPSPLEILIEEEERAFVRRCLSEVPDENRLGFQAKYGIGKYPSITCASRDADVTRPTLYNQHNGEMKKVKEKLSTSGLA